MTSDSIQGSQTVFPGDSEMSRRMAATAWDASPLGSPDRWPAGLKAPLAMMLSSRFEMWLGWGEDLQFFYNDAYIPTLGAKHPNALGKPFREVWSEVYADVEDQVRTVMSEGRATWNKALLLLLERNGYPEETYHTFSYSPLRDEGAVRGLMCVVTEETERVISERRLDTLRRLGEHLMDARSPDMVLEGVCEALAANTHDFPFALAYGRGRQSEWRGHATTPEAEGLLAHPWSLDGAAGVTVSRLERALACPTGAWAIPPADCMIVPIAGMREATAATLVLGLNPHRPEDPGLRDLALLIADRVAGAFAQAQGFEEQRRRSDRIWTNARDLMVVVDPDGLFSSVSPAWTRILGHEVGDVIGRPLDDFVIDKDLEATRDIHRRIRDGEQVTGFENRVRTLDGDWRWISWNTASEDGLVYGYGRDVTDEKAQADQLRRAEEALRQAQKMEAIGQLTGGVAHDFNNLLTIIRSSADLLRSKTLTPERQRRYVDAISDTADRAAKLTSQLLAFSRQQALTPELFDATTKVQDLGDMLRSLLGARIQVEVVASSDDCMVEADLTQFETALINMAVNARDAMDGEGRLTIRIAARGGIPPIRGHAPAAGEFISIAVSDNGTGISDDDLIRIFEPFFTTKAVGQGTGLGLSQVYGFAKQSGGDVAVDSRLGEGATFTLYLPRRRKAPVTVTRPHARPPEEGGGRVLVVEDNAAVGEFAMQLLNDLGYTAEWASSTSEALDRLERFGNYDLVFSDVVMPGGGGVELARTIRARWPDLPVILVSGYSHVLATDARHGFPLLHKPYSVEELSRVLRRRA